MKEDFELKLRAVAEKFQELEEMEEQFTDREGQVEQLTN